MEVIVYLAADKTQKDVLLRMENVVFQYNEKEMALNNIDLTVYRGEKIALLGANGSGKSTILKVMAGLLFPQKGVYEAFGRIITEKNLENESFSQAFRRRVGVVFQNADIQLFSSEVWDEIAFGPIQMDLSEEEVRKRVDEIITALGLEQLKHRPPYHLSGGEKKKVAIASVLSINPQVLLLDEPAAGLDPKTQRWLINLLMKLNEAGKTVITATHDLDIIEEIADRVIVFNEDHSISLIGTPPEVLSNKDLLLSVNLIDEHFHRHRHESGHVHYHAHSYR